MSIKLPKVSPQAPTPGRMPQVDYMTTVPDGSDVTTDALMKDVVGNWDPSAYFHSQSPIAGHVFDIFHSIGQKTR
jgi:hypothetical protein